MGNSGQGCILPTRLLVEDSVYDEVVGMVVGMCRQMKVGDPFEADTILGPVINEQACKRILGVIDRARDEQAGTLLTGGSRVGGDLANGYFVD